MDTHNLILIEKLCSHYEIELSFFDELETMGLIEIKTIKKVQFIHQDSISDLEKMIRLHHELAINAEGIDVVFNLLKKVDKLEEELNSVRNRLQLFENDY